MKMAENEAVLSIQPTFQHHSTNSTEQETFDKKSEDVDNNEVCTSIVSTEVNEEIENPTTATDPIKDDCNTYSQEDANDTFEDKQSDAKFEEEVPSNSVAVEGQKKDCVAVDDSSTANEDKELSDDADEEQTSNQANPDEVHHIKTIENVDTNLASPKSEMVESIKENHSEESTSPVQVVENVAQSSPESDESHETTENGFTNYKITQNSIKGDSLTTVNDLAESELNDSDVNMKVEIDNHVNEESSNTSSSEELQGTKRKAKDYDNSIKRLRAEIQEDFISRDRILSEFMELSDCHNSDQIETQSQQILSEIKILNELASEKEREWNNIIHLKKIKEELLMRLQRRKKIIDISTGKCDDVDATIDIQNNSSNESETIKNYSNKNSHKLNTIDTEKSIHKSSSNETRRKNASVVNQIYSSELNGDSKQGRQRAVLDVQSIIADYRQRHPESVPRRGRRIRNNQGNGCKNSTTLGDSNSDFGNILLKVMEGNKANLQAYSNESNNYGGEPSFRDMLVQFAKMSQIERNELFQNVTKQSASYPEVTVHPVTTTNTTSPSNSLLHGILTKNPIKQNTKTSFSPTLARLLTAPERGNGAVNSPQNSNLSSNSMSINEILSTSKARNEITITPVSSNSEGAHKTKTRPEDEEADDNADRLVIDESMDMSDVRSRCDNNSDIGDEVPQCQGCNQKSALFVCAGCGNQWYCSRDCQVAAWDEHSEVCSG